MQIQSFDWTVYLPKLKNAFAQQIAFKHRNLLTAYNLMIVKYTENICFHFVISKKFYPFIFEYIMID